MIETQTQTTYQGARFLWWCDSCDDLNVDFNGTDDSIVLKFADSGPVKRFILSFLQYSAEPEFIDAVRVACVEKQEASK